MAESNEFATLQKEGCLTIDRDLMQGALAIDPTTAKCRDYIWNNFVKPRYFDKGITTYWLDETDGEGTVRVSCIILAGCCRHSAWLHVIDFSALVGALMPPTQQHPPSLSLRWCTAHLRCSY